MDKTIRINEETYEKILKLTKKENRTIKGIVDRAVKQYKMVAHGKFNQ